LPSELHVFFVFSAFRAFVISALPSLPPQNKYFAYKVLTPSPTTKPSALRPTTRIR